MKLEALIRQLFNAQDLNSDGVLEEAELAQLNEKIARLRYGTASNAVAMRTKGRAIFRDRLDAFGRPVPYPTFRKYVLEILRDLDPDEAAQEMILQQFITEVSKGGLTQGAPGAAAFRYNAPGGLAQAPYMPVATRRMGFMPVAHPCRIGFTLTHDPRVHQMVAL
jgi:hypothetical protein